MQQCCVVHQFSQLANLNEHEITLLQTLECEPHGYDASEIIREQGEQADNFFTLRAGWAYAGSTLADGERKLLDIFLPGKTGPFRGWLWLPAGTGHLRGTFSRKSRPRAT